jgi:hypothetical protein
MSTPDVSESFVIVGQTSAGKRFRPSDWAERLCGVMAPYGPAGSRGGPLTYSPYVMPGSRDGIKCVSVDARLHGIEPMAYRFLLNFARENDLQVDRSPQAAQSGQEAAKESPSPARSEN